MGKGARYGKYLGKKGWGQAHHLHPKDWGDTREFKGSDLQEYAFRNPVTGEIYILHALEFEDAQRVAQSRGWRRFMGRY